MLENLEKFGNGTWEIRIISLITMNLLSHCLFHKTKMNWVNFQDFFIIILEIYMLKFEVIKKYWQNFCVVQQKMNNTLRKIYQDYFCFELLLNVFKLRINVLSSAHVLGRHQEENKSADTLLKTIFWIMFIIVHVFS